MSAAFTPAPLLRNALALDALASGAMGGLLALGAAPLSTLLGLQQTLLFGAGLACLVWAAFVGWASRRDALPGLLVWAIIVLNGLWVVESALLLMLGWAQPNTLGVVFVIAQAAVVFALTEAQVIGLRRSTAREAAAA